MTRRRSFSPLSWVSKVTSKNSWMPGPASTRTPLALAISTIASRAFEPRGASAITLSFAAAAMARAVRMLGSPGPKMTAAIGPAVLAIDWGPP